MTYTWKVRIFMIVGSCLALWLGSNIAEMELFWPSLITGVLLLMAVAHFQPLPVGTLFTGAAMFGYIVGNRGFAQLSVSEKIPLLPAELVLIIAGGSLLATSVLTRTTPLRKDAINIAILAWALLSSIRLVGDFGEFGAIAVRDYATVYYCSFFFIVQYAGRRAADHAYLEKCFYAGSIVLVAIFPFYTAFPDFFIEHFLVRGIPLIYYKGDLLGTFLAAGAIIAFVRYEKNRSLWDLALCLAMVAETMSSNNRASMLGLVLPAVALALAGRPRFLVTMAISGAAAIVVLFLVAQVRGQRFEETPIHSMYERVVSLTDPLGEKNYSGEETSYKGDNNAFRTIWWKIVIDQTIRTNPWYGLGWGFDLADEFTRVYYPVGGDEFAARSPHNVLITIFGRTGLLGLVPFLAFMAIFVRRFWRSIRDGGENVGNWCACATILTSSCFGIVLEGPMGAVIFWSLLGLSCSGTAEIPAEASDDKSTRSVSPQSGELSTAMAEPSLR